MVDSRYARIFKQSDVTVAVTLLGVIAILAAARSTHYLFFHTMAELCAIVVSFSIFVLALLCRRYLVNGYLMVLGGSFGAIGMVDIFHTLTFKGMNLFPEVTVNYPTQFWLTARFLEAMALLLGPLVFSRNVNFAAVSSGFGAVALAACLAVMYQWFPATFVDGVGLTPFKIYCEYCIVAMLVVALFSLWRIRNRFEPRIFVLLLGSLLFAIATEICFTRYGRFYDFANELGHYFRVLTVAFAFMAIVMSGVRQPLELVFRELEKKKHELAISEGQLRRAQSLAKVGSWHVDMALPAHTWSEETYHIFGLPVGSEIRFETFASCIHPEDRAAVALAWANAMTGKKYDIEHRIIVQDEVRWVREVAEMRFANDGSVLEALGTVQDISQGKRDKALLEESRAFNLSVFDSVVESVAVLDGKGIIIAVNEPWRAFAMNNGGQTIADKFVGMDYLEICARGAEQGVDLSSCATAIAIKAVLGGTLDEFNLEYPCHSPTSKRWFHLRISPLRAPGGGAVVAHEDITASRVAQDTLRLSEESYRRQFSDNGAVMLMLNPLDGRIIDANSAAQAFYGYTRAQLLAMAITQINPMPRADIERLMQAAAKEGTKHFEVQHLLANGTLRDVEVFSSRIEHAQRTTLHVIVFDISERKKAQAARIESENRYRLLFDTSIDAILLTAPDGQIFSANLAACALLQRTEEEIRVAGRDGIVDTSDPALAVALEQRRLTGNFVGEAIFVRKDGKKIQCEVSTTTFRDSNGEQRASIILRDIGERKRIEMALRESEARMSAIFQFSPLGIVVSRIDDGRLLDINDATLHLFGYSRQEVIGKSTVTDLGAYANPAQRQAMVRRLREHGSVYNFPVDYRTRDGKDIVLEISGRLIELAGQSCFLAIAADVTERQRNLDQLRLAASVFTYAREGIMITEADATILDVNDKFCQMTGYRRSELIGQNPRILQSGRQGPEFYSAMWRELHSNGYWDGEIWNRRKDGGLFIEMLSICAVHDETGHLRHFVALCSDITALKNHETALEHIAHFDALTNLPNRVLLSDRLRQGMAQAQRHSQLLAVAYLDLDGFKSVNDTLGHEAGDSLLTELASRMKCLLREGDTLARLGGDEFVAVLLDLEDVSACLPMLNRLLAAAAESVQIGGHTLAISASLGVSIYPQTEDVDADTLLRQADQAMYEAKLAGKNRYHIFDPEQDRSVRGHHESLEHIRHALRNGEFVLHYQPKVNMRTGVVLGVEALIRWQHSQRGLVPPAEFLPVIEDHPLAIELGEWVIDAALRQVEVWLAEGLDLNVSVNIGARQLQQPGFLTRLSEILAVHATIHPSRLELEVLETSALQDIAHVSSVIRECRRMGVGFALDDFGTGYSSLTYLKRLPVNMLKIDRSFVRDMLDDPDNLSILEGVMGLSIAFNREVLAEGVETVEHGTTLLQLGCELAQGYCIARAMPAHMLANWAANWRIDAAWASVPTCDRVNLPLLHARVEHRCWVSAVENYVHGKVDVPPSLDSRHSRFYKWLEAVGPDRHVGHSPIVKIDPLFRQAHELAERMIALSDQEQRPKALEQLARLHTLRDQLLDHLSELLVG